jgi:hypothetical protein
MDVCGQQSGAAISASTVSGSRSTLRLRAGAHAVADRPSTPGAIIATRICVRKNHKGPLSALTL